MPVYSSKRPVKVLNGDSNNYVEEHLAYFFKEFSLNAWESLPQDKKERVYKVLTDYEDILIKIFGSALLNSDVFLPELLRKSVNNKLVNDYKLWLDKQ